jgi:DMSO/TMAO reductase YedYZ heme-binding membrane subunit
MGVTASHVFWYTSRGTALSALVALSLALGLGQILASGVRSRRWPRVASNEAHRLLSLAATGLIVLHVATVLADGYLPFRPLDVVVPFQAPYRSLTVGLGTLAFDTVLVVLLLVAFRRRLGYARWRRTHRLAYVVWGLAVVHGLGSGTDTSAWWMRGTTALCVAAVAGGIACRIGADRQLSLPIAAAGATLALVLAAVLGQPATGAHAPGNDLLTPISLSWKADQGRTLEEVSMLGVGPIGHGVRFRLDLVLGVSGPERLQHGLVQLSYPQGHRCRGAIELLRADLLLARCGTRPLRIAFSSFGPGAAQGLLRLG